MINFLKKYWYWVLLILLAPIAINFILLIPVFLPIAGDDKTWLAFWGSYSSALITSMITLFVLYRQLMQNQKENEENRKTNKEENEKNRQLQINAIEYQTQIQWINNLKAIVREVYNAFNVIWLNEIYLIFESTNDANNYTNSELVKDKIKQLYNKLNVTTDNFRLTVIGRDDPEEKKYWTEFDSLRSIYYNLLDDIRVLSSICFYNGTDEMLMPQFNRTINEYKDKCTLINDNSHRIWEIAEKYSMKLKTEKSQIVKDLIEAYEPILMYEWCRDVLNYEYEKSKKIINGTE